MSYGEPFALRGQELEQVAAAPSTDARPLVEAQFIERLRAGEPAAFNRLVEERSGDVYGLLYRLTEDAEEARDLTQETFLRVFQSIERFRGDAGANEMTSVHDEVRVSAVVRPAARERHEDQG